MLDDIENETKAVGVDKDDQTLERKISELKDFLLLLLKYDWEKSKREVRKNWAHKAAIISGLGASCILLAMQLIFLKSIDIYMIYGLICFLLFPGVLGMLLYDDKKGLIERVAKIACILLIILYMILYFGHYIKNGQLKLDDLHIWIFLLCAFAAGIVFFVWIAMSNRILDKYIDEIKKVEARYRENSSNETLSEDCEEAAS